MLGLLLLQLELAQGKQVHLFDELADTLRGLHQVFV